LTLTPRSRTRGASICRRIVRKGRAVAHLVNDNFRNLARILERLGIGRIDKIFLT